MRRDLTLVVSDGPMRALAQIVTGMLELPQNADVLTYLGPNPWGDLDAYRREVYEPMQSGEPVPDAKTGTDLTIPAADLPMLNGVLHDFYEGFSGGRPWTLLSDSKRDVVQRLARQLPEVGR